MGGEALAGLTICAGMVAIVVWYMRRPNFTRLRVSAARFLPEFSPPKDARSVWRFSAPLSRWRLYLRLALGGLLLAALVDWTATPSTSEALRVAVVVDVSHSMNAAVPDVRGSDVLADALAQVTDRLRALDPPPNSCIAFRTVGASVRERVLSDPDQLRRLRLDTQPVGAPAAILLAAVRLITPDCPATHTVVITDRPMPPMPDAPLREALIWIDVSQARSNVAIAGIGGVDATLDGVPRTVVDIAGYGDIDGALTLTIETAVGVQTLTVDTTAPSPWRVPVSLAAEEAILTVTPGGAYGGDDRVIMSVGEVRRRSVEWRLENMPMPSIPGWQAVEDGQAGDLRVLSISASQAVDLARDVETSSGIPSVFVYPGLRPIGEAGTRGPLGFFVERASILQDVNLDLLELTVEAPAALDPALVPILRNAKGLPIIAYGASPRRVIIPGPVESRDGQTRALSLTLLFNALRWVQGSDDPRARLDYRTADGTQVKDALLESDTAQRPGSFGSLDTLALSEGPGRAEPFWPWLVLAAAFVLLIERLVGVAWRLDPAGRAAP